MLPDSHSFQPIGIVHSCFKEKFGIPRQAGLVPDAEAELELLPPYDREEAVRGLEAFSHLWLVFVFHAVRKQQWKPTVRPPRLGGNQRMGVFASRSPFRPNPIGLSVVRMGKIERVQGRLLIGLGGIDLLDGTPVLDIKPYVPYADALPHANGGFADTAPEGNSPVMFDPACEPDTLNTDPCTRERLKRLITQVLAQDPRPAYMDDNLQPREFGMRLLEFDIRWRFENGVAHVLRICKSEPGHA